MASRSARAADSISPPTRRSTNTATKQQPKQAAFQLKSSVDSSRSHSNRRGGSPCTWAIASNRCPNPKSHSRVDSHPRTKSVPRYSRESHFLAWSLSSSRRRDNAIHCRRQHIEAQVGSTLFKAVKIVCWTTMRDERIIGWKHLASSSTTSRNLDRKD